MNASESQGQRAVVIGAGAVGRVLAERLAIAGWTVHVVDRAPSQVTKLVAGCSHNDVRRGLGRDTSEWIAKASVVVLALPEPVIAACIETVGATMQDGALLVETSSVKSPLCQKMRSLMHRLEVVGINPMFSPALGFDARPIAWVAFRQGFQSSRFRYFLSSLGARVVEVGVEEHDRACAICQVLPHAAILSFGAALTFLGANVEQIRNLAPPPMNIMLSLLARMTAGAVDTYWDIQAANPFAEEVRAAVKAQAARLHEIVNRNDAPEFAALLEGASRALGGPNSDFEKLASTIFSLVHIEPDGSLSSFSCPTSQMPSND